MSDETIDLRLAASVKALARKMAEFCASGRDLDQQTIHDLEEIYRHYRVQAALDRMPFPEMVLVVMDRQRRVRFVRRDLDKSGIDNLAVELAQSQGEAYDPGEVARAIRRAF